MPGRRDENGKTTKTEPQPGIQGDGFACGVEGWQDEARIGDAVRRSTEARSSDGKVRRKVPAWRLSTTLETEPCIEVLKEAIRRHGKPEILNTDQDSQVMSVDFIKTLQHADIQISTDEKGAWRDNRFVERLWRTRNYKQVYLRAHDSVSAARESSRRYLTFCNPSRPHSSLDGQTPDPAYRNPSRPIPVTAQPSGKSTYQTARNCSDKPNDLFSLRTVTLNGLVFSLATLPHMARPSEINKRWQGWPRSIADLNDEDILFRLVALNKERAGDEVPGQIRWHRPDYQKRR